MSDKKAISEARKRANAKHDEQNYQYISFKARKGSRERITAAAKAVGESTNGFIRVVLNKAVLEATGQPMEQERQRDEKTADDESRRQRAAVARFREAMRSSGPLPPEFDEVMKERVNITREIDL